MDPNISRIRTFYKNVDGNNVEAAVSIFSTNARYQRGTRIFSGMNEIRDFYASGRVETILSGMHAFESIEQEGNIVTVIGTFEGEYSDDTAGPVRFVDRFEFDDDLVSHRTTTFPGREI